MSIIRTKFLGATNHSGARVKATTGKASVTFPYDYATSGDMNHAVAAKRLANKLNLQGRWAKVWDESQRYGNTYVCVTDTRDAFIVNELS